MSLRIEYHDLVDVDLLEAWVWYEGQERGLGDRFLDAVDATVSQASRWPNVGTPLLRDDNDAVVERKIATHGFPFAVRSRVLDEQLVVMAVLHQHRSPNFGDGRRPWTKSQSARLSRPIRSVLWAQGAQMATQRWPGRSHSNPNLARHRCRGALVVLPAVRRSVGV